jgi:hypothetical protein
MNRQEILKFIADNQDDKLLDFYDKCYDKLNDLNKRIDKLTLYLIIVAFLYFIASKTIISSFQIGPVAISDISILVKIIPALFAFLLLQIVVISSQKGELFTVVKFLFLANYKQDINYKELSNDKNNLFTRLLLPFSYSTELLKFNSFKQNALNSCVGAILVVPLFSLIFLPFWFEYFMLKVIWTQYYIDVIGIVSFWLSVWILAFVIFYLVTSMIQNYRDLKSETV